MPTLHPSVIQITPVVYDFMFIEINERHFENVVFEYKIFDKKGQLIRKGSFKGLTIQLRLTHLEDGKYNFEISADKQDSIRCLFEKRSPQDAEQIVIHTHH